MRKIRVGDLAGVPLLGVTVIATANPCKIERVGAIPSISTNFLRGKTPVTLERPVIRQAYPLLYSRVAQQKEQQQLAKLKAAGAIPAVGTNLWIVNAAAGGTCLENRWNSLVRGLG
jgi:hypothetical protein